MNVLLSHFLMLLAPRSLASIAACHRPRLLILLAKAIMDVVLPEPRNPLVTIYFVVIKNLLMIIF